MKNYKNKLNIKIYVIITHNSPSVMYIAVHPKGIFQAAQDTIILMIFYNNKI